MNLSKLCSCATIQEVARSQHPHTSCSNLTLVRGGATQTIPAERLQECCGEVSLVFGMVEALSFEPSIQCNQGLNLMFAWASW